MMFKQTTLPSYAALLKLLAATHAAHAGTFQFTSLQISGQNNSFANGLNDNDVVVGDWNLPGGGWHGFVWSGGVFTQVDGAGFTAATTLLAGVNDSGIVVGDYFAGNSAFTYDIATGQQTQIKPPKKSGIGAVGIAASGTVFGPLYQGRKQYSYTATNGVVTPFTEKHTSDLAIAAIDTQGTLLGSYVSKRNGHPGFTYAGGQFTSFTVNGDKTYPTFFGLNGAIGGYYLAGQSEYGFLTLGSNTVTYAYPGAIDTRLIGQTSGGLVAGTIYDGQGVQHGFVSDGTNYYSYDPPGSTDTTVTGVNANGSLVGNYVASDGHIYGFVAICPAGQAPCTQ
jgi:hypothetical protein